MSIAGIRRGIQSPGHVIPRTLINREHVPCYNEHLPGPRRPVAPRINLNPNSQDIHEQVMQGCVCIY